MSLSCSLFLSLSPSLYCRWTPVEALLPCTHEPLARTASRALQDAAAKWWSPYKSFNLPWEEFCELLRNKFADTATTIRLQTQLYFTKQQEKEPGRQFLQRNYLHAKRLPPNDTEEEFVSLIMETLKPSIRKVLCTANPTRFTDLINRAYLDDIIIYSNTVEEHLVQLGLVLENLESYGLTCNPKKCHFGQKKLYYLDHVVTTEGNQPQPEHVRAILEASSPKTWEELRRFLGIK